MNHDLCCVIQRGVTTTTRLSSQPHEHLGETEIRSALIDRRHRNHVAFSAPLCVRINSTKTESQSDFDTHIQLRRDLRSIIYALTTFNQRLTLFSRGER